jgi:hypothetical protein
MLGPDKASAEPSERKMTGDDRLATDLWLRAQMRQCYAKGVAATVLHKGDDVRGLLILKINLLNGRCRLLSQTRDLEGNLAWFAAAKEEELPEDAADSYIARAIARDPDLWAVEVESRDGWHPFEGKVLKF